MNTIALVLLVSCVVLAAGVDNTKLTVLTSLKFPTTRDVASDLVIIEDL